MSYRDKIVARDDLAARLAHCPRPLVFTNGVFDLLHPGHVEYLAAARGLGAELIVGLNSDISVRRLGKGDDRPINPEQDRALMLGALEAVSLVVLFDEQSPLEVLKVVKPDIYVKGGDYDIAILAETALVQTWGGRAAAIDFLPGYSSTRLVERIRARRPAP